MAKTVDLSKMKDDIDKKFEKLSPAAARRIDNGGTMPKSSAKKPTKKNKSSK
jgi:hypothetical protein